MPSSIVESGRPDDFSCPFDRRLKGGRSSCDVAIIAKLLNFRAMLTIFDHFQCITYVWIAMRALLSLQR